MAVKIHHGPPGSYKTSGAVMDDFVDAVFDGRVVITNVRGLDNAERIRTVLSEEFPRREIPASFDLVWIDCETEEGIYAIQTFWHWADCGAFLLIDEAQMFWPCEMRPSDYAEFDFPSFRRGREVIHSNVEMAGFHKRPRDYSDAWTRHRHFNWDIVLTTPDIKLFHTKIRSVSEAAYLHKNQALVGLRGRYLEGFHLASSNGFSSDLLTVRTRKIPSWVFDLYQSTSTGVVRDTDAGLAFWKNPKILGLSCFLVLVLAFVASRGNPFNIFRPKGALSSEASDPAATPVSAASSGPSSGAPSRHAPSDPFLDLKTDSIWLVGSQTFYSGSSVLVTYLFEIKSADETMGSTITSETLTRLGYSITPIHRNLVSVQKDGKETFIRSRGVQSEKKDVL